MQLMVIIGIVIAIAGVAFALQNSVPVAVVFLFWRFDGSLAMVLLLALAVGALVIALVSTPAALRSRWTANRQRKEIESLQEANASLRARIAELESRSPQGGSAAAPPRESSPGGVVGLKAIAAQFGSPPQGPGREG